MECMWDTNQWNSQAVMYFQACSSLMHALLHQWEHQDNDQVYFYILQFYASKSVMYISYQYRCDLIFEKKAMM